MPGLPNHATLYPHLVNQLVPGGTLAVQTPDNLDEPAHRLARGAAAHGPADSCRKAAFSLSVNGARNGLRADALNHSTTAA